MKKYYKILTLMLVFLIGFSGCSKNTAANKKELVVWCHLSNNEILKVDELAQQWGKKTGNKVKVYTDKGDNRAFIEASSRNMQPDIEFGIPHDRLEKLNSKKLLAEVPVGLVDKNKYIPTAIETTSFNNKLYGVPISVETYGLYYNKNMVKNPPTTLEELISEGEKLGFQYDINNFYISYPFIQANGGYIFKKDNGKYQVTDIGLNNEGAIQGYTMIQDMVKKYKLIPENVDNIAARKNFQSSKIAFYLSGSWDINEIDKYNSNYAVAKLPTWNGKQMKAFVTCQTAFVTDKSKDKKEVWDLFKFLVENSSETLYKSTGRLPALKLENTISEIKNNDKLKMFVEQAQFGETVPNVTEIQALQDANKIFKSLTTGEISPKECGAKIENNIKEFIKKEKQ